MERRIWKLLMFLGLWRLPTCAVFRHGRFAWPLTNPHFLFSRPLALRWAWYGTWCLNRFLRYPKRSCPFAGCLEERRRQQRVLADIRLHGGRMTRIR